MRSIFRFSTAIALVLSAAASASAAEWANLTGQFVFQGTPPKPQPIIADKDTEVCGLHRMFSEDLVVNEKGGIANVVVMLRTKNVPVAPMYADSANAKVVLDNNGCQFVPHVLVVRTSQTLEIKNSDPVAHNSKVDPAKNLVANPILAPGSEPFTYKFTEEEGVPIKVTCSIHTWMGAQIVARNDPYAGISDKDGKFKIEQLPANVELEFGLWQENAQNLKDVAYKGGKADNRGRFKIKLKPGDNDLGEIKVPSALFKK